MGFSAGCSPCARMALVAGEGQISQKGCSGVVLPLCRVQRLVFALMLYCGNMLWVQFPSLHLGVRNVVLQTCVLYVIHKLFPEI